MVCIPQPRHFPQRIYMNIYQITAQQCCKLSKSGRTSDHRRHLNACMCFCSILLDEEGHIKLTGESVLSLSLSLSHTQTHTHLFDLYYSQWGNGLILLTPGIRMRTRTFSELIITRYLFIFIPTHNFSICHNRTKGDRLYQITREAA